MYNYKPDAAIYRETSGEDYDKPGPDPLVPPEPKDGKKPTLLEKLTESMGKIFG